MDKKRRHLIIFGFLAAITYIIWKLVFSFRVTADMVSHLEWTLLVVSFFTLIIGEMGIFTGKRYGFYVMTIFLLSVFIETIRANIPVTISLPFFLAGNAYLVYTYRLQSDDNAK